MSAGFQLEGFDDLSRAIEALPEDLSRRELAPVVRSHSEGLAGELRSFYDKGGTGTLASRVVVEPGKDARGLRMKVRSKAPHAHLYEFGTIQRFTAGTGANRGTMPAQPTFIPAAIRWRDRMKRAAKTALQSLRVPGFTGSPGVRES